MPRLGTLLLAVAIAVPTIAFADTLAQFGARREAPAPASMQPPGELTGQMLYEFLIAEIALQRGQMNVAAQAYADLAKRTRDPRIAQRATEVAIYARLPNAAVDAARVWHETSENSEESLRALTALLVGTNRLDEAQPYLEKTIAGSKDGEAFLQLNQILASVPDKAAALKIVRRLAQAHPGVAQAHFAIAQAAANANDDALALTESRNALKIRPDWELPVLLESSVLQKTSNRDALARLKSFIDTNPKAREVRLAYARTLVADRQYEIARKEFQSLTDDYPDNTEVIYSVALLSMQLEDWPRAEANLKRLLTLDFADRNQVHLWLGQVSEEQKRYPDAIDWYKRIDRGEHLLNAQIRQSMATSKQGDLAAARAILREASPENNQQRVQLILAESQLLRDANQPKEALDLLEKSIERVPNNPDLIYDYAMVAEKLDLVEVMEKNLRRVIELKADHAHAYNALGYSLADRNMRLSEARELIEKAVKLAPNDYYIMDSLGWVLFREGKTEEALKVLQTAYEGRPDAEIGAHLGEVLWMLNRRSEAEKIWAESMKRAPENEVLQKTIKRLKQP